VWVLRVRDPKAPRQFRVPMVPVVSSLGVIVCGAMIFGLGWPNWSRLGVWLAIGLVLYFTYGIRKSKLQKGTPPDAAPAAANEGPGE
jgi:APA family basic amino acid/polyamine antiporter